MPIERGWTGPKIKGHQRLALMHDLAVGDMTNVEIADKYDRSESSIYSYKRNHAAEIDAIRADLSNEFAALWVAKKVNRVAAYQDDIEDLAEIEDDINAVRVKHQALRAVAEEMGQLTTKAEVQASVTYQVEGVDTEAMR